MIPTYSLARMQWILLCARAAAPLEHDCGGIQRYLCRDCGYIFRNESDAVIIRLKLKPAVWSCVWNISWTVSRCVNARNAAR